MLALAMFGFAGDAQRYADSTYMTKEFLRKTETFSVEQIVQRHQ